MDQQNEIRKKDLKRNLLFLATAIAMTVYITWRALFTLPLEYGLPSLIIGALLLVCEAVAGLEAAEQYLNMVYSFRPELPQVPDSWYPDVDVFVVTHNESLDLIYKTVNACTHMNYPDRKKVHVYICDDGDRREMGELAQRLGVGYFGLSGNKHAKSGNFNNALSQTSSPLVATFDADMIPHRNFLTRTVPYFFLPQLKKTDNGQWIAREPQEIDPDYRIGFIQTPQSFYNPDLFQYNLHAEQRVPNEQDYFFREINVGRNRTNTSIFCGSNALISRRALEEVGGMATGTITEDFETGMKIQGEGYSTYAIEETLAHGLAPHTIGSLISQRERWARGCVQSLRHVRPFFRKSFSLPAKFSYLACLVYWWTFGRRFVYIAAPIISTLLGMHLVQCTLWQLMIFWLPYYLLNNKTLTVLSGSTRTQHWSNLVDTIMFPYLILPIILETIGIKKRKFVVTKKSHEAESANLFVLVLPHLALLAASAVSLVICIMQSLEVRSVYNAIIIFWLIVNGKNLALAIFFMMGRQNLRQADRFTVKMPAEINRGRLTYSGQTTDVSETGISVVFDSPVFLPDDDSFKVRLASEPYQAEMWCRVAHVDPQTDEGWRYSLRLTDIDDENRRAFYQIVYDRKHTLAEAVVETLTVLEDFSINIDRRLNRAHKNALRRLPRIKVGALGRLVDGRSVFIEDFNYKYLWLNNPLGFTIEGEFTVAVGPGLEMSLKAVENKARPGRGGGLYQILNWRELIDDPLFGTVVDGWVAGKRDDSDFFPTYGPALGTPEMV